MKKIAVSSLVSLFILSCSVPVANNSTRESSSSLSVRMQYAPTGLRDTSSPSSQTPLLGGAGLGSLHPSLIKYNFAELEKEYKSFKTKALSYAYIKRMFVKYLNPVNQTQLTRQLEFSRYLKNNGDASYETSLKSMFLETPALYDIMTGISAPDIQNKMSTESATFGTFVTGLSPYPGVPVAASATTIASTSFTANWNSSANSTGYKLYLNGSLVYTGTGTSFNVTGLTANTTYSYYIIATNNSGDSQTSNTITLNTISSLSGKIAFSSNRDGNNEIYVINADGSSPFRLTNNTYNDDEPEFSPDGAKVAFTSSRTGGWEIYKINVNGTGETRVTTNPSDDHWPSWTPDGSAIFFDCPWVNQWEIDQINADSSNEHRVLRGSTGDANANQYGSKLVFASSRSGRWQIYTMNTDASNQTIVGASSGHDTDPAWSPDGTKILFHSLRDGNDEIYVMNADGSAQKRLTNNSSTDSFPCWSPDGTKIAFHSDRSGKYQIYVMDAADINNDNNGDNLIRVTNNSTDDKYPSWK